MARYRNDLRNPITRWYIRVMGPLLVLAVVAAAGQALLDLLR